MQITTIDQEVFLEIAEIYRQGLETGNATFETIVPTWEDWDKSKLKDIRIAAVIDNIMVGRAALTVVSDRSVDRSKIIGIN